MIEDKKVQEFLNKNKNLETPYLIVNTDIIKNQYSTFTKNFKNALVYYAVKCNPDIHILKTLNALGSKFDVASLEEVLLCKEAGIKPQNMSWGSTIKKASHIAKAFEMGVDTYAFDSYDELVKISENAKGSKVYCRIIVSNDNALWPLSNKFGCSVSMAEDLMVKAKELGLVPYGISFHVGSQQLDASSWENPIKEASKIFNNLKSNFNISLEMLNIGGGYPAYGYKTKAPAIGDYASSIYSYIDKYFEGSKPIIFTEPGRYIVADSGLIKTEVILVSYKDKSETTGWIYTDVGVFGGLAETIGECILYDIHHDVENPSNTSKFAIAGPTCDGMDIMYMEHLYDFPSNIKGGNNLYILSTGAYTTTYSSICFNGFKPLKSYYI